MTDDARTGYATENVINITALDKANLDALLAELPRTQHEHGPYGWRGCTSCRHLYAEAVAERFPPK